MNFTTAAKKLLNPNYQVIERMEFGDGTNNEHPYAPGVYLAHNFNKKPSSKTLDFVCLCKDTGQQCRSDSCIRYYKYRACGDNCRNEDCQNKGLASRMNSNFSEQMGLIVDDVNSKGLGLGVLTNSFIPANADIATYFGKAIRGDAVFRYAKTNNYLVQLGDGAGTCIDGKYTYSYARFINHSCEPNCTLVPHQEVSGDRYVIVRTITDIQPDEQITVNYGFTELSHGELPTKCSCDSKSCTGFVELGGETAVGRLLRSAAHADEALPGEARRVLHEVEQDLHEHQPIGHHVRLCVGHLHPQLHARLQLRPHDRSGRADLVRG